MQWPGIRDGNRRQGVLQGKGHRTRRDITPPGRAGVRRNGDVRERGERHRGSTGISSSVHAGRRSASTQDAAITQDTTIRRRRAAPRRGTRTGEASIPRRFNRVWRSCRPHEERTQRGRPSKEAFAGGVGPNTPRDTPQRSLRILTGWPTPPWSPDIPDAPGGACRVWVGRGNRRGQGDR